MPFKERLCVDVQFQFQGVWLCPCRSTHTLQTPVNYLKHQMGAENSVSCWTNSPDPPLKNPQWRLPPFSFFLSFKIINPNDCYLGKADHWISPPPPSGCVNASMCSDVAFHCSSPLPVWAGSSHCKGHRLCACARLATAVIWIMGFVIPKTDEDWD